MTLVIIIYGAGFRLYKIVMTNDLSWLMYGFTWKGVTTGLAHCMVTAEVEVLTQFLTEVRLHYVYAAGCRNPMTLHHTSQKLSLLDFWTFDPLDFWPYVFRLMNAFFLPPRQLLVSVHVNMAWKSTSNNCSRKVIHHWLLGIFSFCQRYVNGCMVMHWLFWKCFQAGSINQCLPGS